MFEKNLLFFFEKVFENWESHYLETTLLSPLQILCIIQIGKCLKVSGNLSQGY